MAKRPAKQPAKPAEKKTAGRSGKIVAALGLAAAGAVAAGAALASARKAKADNAPEAPQVDDTIVEPLEDVDFSPTTMPVSEPLRYTGTGTPDMAINYTPGADGSADRVAGDDSQAIGNAEEREALAGVGN